MIEYPQGYSNNRVARAREVTRKVGRSGAAAATAAAAASWLPLVLWLASCRQAAAAPSPAMSRPCQPQAREMENLLAQCLAEGTLTVQTPTTALQNLEEGRSVLRTGVAALDRVLRGGFPCRSLR
jgi:hypothetical protein